MNCEEPLPNTTSEKVDKSSADDEQFETLNNHWTRPAGNDLVEYETDIGEIVQARVLKSQPKPKTQIV